MGNTQKTPVSSGSVPPNHYYSTKKERRDWKVVVCGDNSIGKTCTLIRMTEGRFQDCYVPTVFDNIQQTASVEDNTFKYSLWDTAGSPDYKRLRALNYPETDLFILAF